MSDKMSDKGFIVKKLIAIFLLIVFNLMFVIPSLSKDLAFAEVLLTFGY